MSCFGQKDKKIYVKSKISYPSNNFLNLIDSLRTLEFIMKDSKLYKLLYGYMKSTYQEEQLDFIEIMNGIIDKKIDDKKLDEKLTTICNYFIKENSKFQINISSLLRHQIEKNINSVEDFYSDK